MVEDEAKFGSATGRPDIIKLTDPGESVEGIFLGLVEREAKDKTKFMAVELEGPDGDLMSLGAGGNLKSELDFIEPSDYIKIVYKGKSDYFHPEQKKTVKVNRYRVTVKLVDGVAERIERASAAKEKAKKAKAAAAK